MTRSGDTPAPDGGAGSRDGPVPVVYATDIGTDVDDTWALAQLLRAPELDLRLVVTETGDPRYRAALVAKLLERAGRTDVPVALGVEEEMDDARRTQAPWVDDYALAEYSGPVHEDGVAATADVLDDVGDGGEDGDGRGGSSGPAPVVVSVGPTPTLAAVVERDPALADWRFVGMHGSFESGYGGPDSDPDAEYNVAADPAALRTVLAADWAERVLTPLDTCGRVRLAGERYHRVWTATDDPLVRAVVENNCIFAARLSWSEYDDFTRRSSTLFDTVAVALAHDESRLEIERRRFDVTDDGYTVPDPDGEFAARVALDWRDREGFADRLTDVVLGEV